MGLRDVSASKNALKQFFFLQKIGMSGCSIYEITKQKVLACPLVDEYSYSLLSVKKSLCTIFFGTPCRFYFIVKRLKNAFLMYIYKVRIRNFDKSKIVLWFTTGRGVRGGLWSKNSFLGKIRFKSYIIKNLSRKSKSKFFTFS